MEIVALIHDAPAVEAKHETLQAETTVVHEVASAPVLEAPAVMETEWTLLVKAPAVEEDATLKNAPTLLSINLTAPAEDSPSVEEEALVPVEEATANQVGTTAFEDT